MKKFLTLFFVLLLSLTTIFAFTACDKENIEPGADITIENLSTLKGKKVGVLNLASFPGLTFKAILDDNNIDYVDISESGEVDKNKVNLKAISEDTSAQEIVPNSEYDYFVVPEPAATAKVNATQGKLSIAASLQDLYGQGGYPQAVIVAKKSTVSDNAKVVGSLLSSFEQNVAWLKAETTAMADVVDAVQSGFINGGTTTLNAGQLNATVINNCSINFVSASESKTDILSYLSKLNAISNNAWGTPVDEFFGSVSGETEVSGATLKLYAPDGAPALSVARLLNDKSIISSIEVNIVKANTIQTYVAGVEPVADICIMPVNAASKILGSANTYQLLGTITHGNLFLLKKSATVAE